MKKILLSVFAVAVVALGAVVATRAYFTDTATVPSDLSSGRLDIELRGPNAGGIIIPVDTTQYFMGGMAPGVEFGPYEVHVYNKGWGQSTLPVKYAWTSVYGSGSQDMYDLLNVKVREGNWDWLGAAWFTEPQGVLYSGLLKDMPNYLQSANSLNPNITRCTWFYFTLDSTAGNALQGQNVLFDLRLDATQTNNPGWTE